MHLLYLDDSGSWKNPNEEYFVLGGVSIPENGVRWLSSQLDKIANEIDPDNIIELHAADIFSGKVYPWNTIKDKKDRINIIKNVLCVIQGAFPNTVIFACAIHKASFPNEDPVLMAFEHLTSRFHRYLEKGCEKRETGIIIIDESSYETGLQNLASDFRRHGNRWGTQLRTVVEVPLFIDSIASRAIQFADHVAYAVFRRYNASDINYFNCIENRFYQKDGIMHGLIHQQTYTRDCTCPACLTRRKDS